LSLRLARLRRIAGDTPFQPETPEVPVQVLGVLEAHALEFDRLFVTGLTDEAWPPPPRPNPFLPVALQRAHRVPHACGEWQLEHARRALRMWSGSAPVVRLSWPRHEGDRGLSASPLLRAIVEAPRTACPSPPFRAAVHAARAVEDLADFRAPALPAGIEVRGGTTLFQNQAACPFKAFATHRLGARALEAVSVGLDATDRGWLVHRAAEQLWRELKNSARLAAAEERELAAAIAAAARAAVESVRRKRPDVVTDAFAALERERLTALLERLVALEKLRTPFAVLLNEEPRPVSVAGVRVATRLDRVDRLTDGGEVVLDYKTSREVNVAGWLGERPDEPQLPLYAASGGGNLAAVAFVQLHARQVRFEGLSRMGGVLPGVPALADSKKAGAHYAGWRDLVESWRAALENLAREFLEGRAEVAPKDYPRTCEYCDLGMLCRVRELKDRGPLAAGQDRDE
jgi:ATP-dependent helicase/nuclease subunit B